MRIRDIIRIREVFVSKTYHSRGVKNCPRVECRRVSTNMQYTGLHIRYTVADCMPINVYVLPFGDSVILIMQRLCCDDTTVMAKWRQVAFIDEFFDIIEEAHCRQKGHIGSKKTIQEVNILSLQVYAR